MIKARSSLLNKQDLEILEGFKKKQQRYLDEATANSELICVWVLILTPFMLLLTWWALLPGMVLAYHLWKCGVAIYRSREVAKRGQTARRWNYREGTGRSCPSASWAR